MNDFVRNALNELKEIQTEESAESDELREIIVESKKKTNVITIGEKDIRIKSYIPNKIKTLLAKVDNIDKEELSPDELIGMGDYVAIKVLSNICIDPPYSTEKFWSLYNQEIGDAQKITLEVIEMLNSNQNRIIKFRTK